MSFHAIDHRCGFAASPEDARCRAPLSPYRTPGYPVIPLLFVLVAGWLMLNTLKTSPVESLAGLALIAAGEPFTTGRTASRKVKGLYRAEGDTRQI